MGVGEFPLFRLATLMARQVSTPIASRIKQYARGHPGLGSAACQRVARLVYAADLRLRLWSLRLPQPRTLPPLSDAAALDYGADIFGEVIVFTLGSLIVIFEVNRQAMNQENKELSEESEWLSVLLQLEELQREVSQQQRDLDRLRAAMQSLADNRTPRPPPPSPSAAHTPLLEQERNKHIK